MPDPVNNETGSLGDGRTPAQTPYDSPSAGGTAQNTTLASQKSPAVGNGGAGNSNQTPLHTDGGNIQKTGAPAEIDIGGAKMPGIHATGMPDWTETLEAINAIPEKIVNALREADLTRMERADSSPMPGKEQAQNTDAPNSAHSATGPSPGEGNPRVHWFYRNFR